MVRMIGMVKRDQKYYEGIFVRNDGELELLYKDFLVLRSASIRQLIETILKSVDINGMIKIYEVNALNTEQRIHKVIEVYNDLEPACN